MHANWLLHHGQLPLLLLICLIFLGSNAGWWWLEQLAFEINSLYVTARLESIYLPRTGGTEVTRGGFSDPESAAHFNHPTTSFMAKSSVLLTAKHCTVTAASIDTSTTTQQARARRQGSWMHVDPHNLKHVHVFNYSGLVCKIDL